MPIIQSQKRCYRGLVDSAASLEVDPRELRLALFLFSCSSSPPSRIPAASCFPTDGAIFPFAPLRCQQNAREKCSKRVSWNTCIMLCRKLKHTQEGDHGTSVERRQMQNISWTLGKGLQADTISAWSSRE